MTETHSAIFVCATCNAKNRIPPDRMGTAATCGKCGASLDTHPEAQLRYKLRCSGCGAKNRIPSGKVDSGAVCGKCGDPLPTAALSAPQPMMISDINFEKEVVASPLPVLLYAWSPT